MWVCCEQMDRVSRARLRKFARLQRRIIRDPTHEKELEAKPDDQGAENEESNETVRHIFPEQSHAIEERCHFMSRLRWILLWGGLDEARHILDYPGWMLGIGGVATYKNGGLDKVLPHVPMERIILETDSPYLSPVPHRGKRNESSYVPLIGLRVAELTGLSVEDVALQTTANAVKVGTSAEPFFQTYWRRTIVSMIAA